MPTLFGLTDVIYLGFSFTGLAALATILALIGRMAVDCPQMGPAARLGTWVVTTGFVAMGTGVIGVIGAFLPTLLDGRGSGIYLSVGVVAIALGTGFYFAASGLRDILTAARRNLDAAAGQAS
jgi:hypothetical protein